MPALVINMGKDGGGQGPVLAGLVPVLFATAAVTAAIITWRYHRFRLLASLAGGTVVAGAVYV